MKAGLQIYSFTWPGGDGEIGPAFARAVRTADEVGFDSIWVMDHFFQIMGPGTESEPMLEGYTALGFAAAYTQRARLGLMVGGIHYRQPGLLIKAVTTLDVLSGGRAWLGLGAAWNQEESEALGFPFPPLSQRYELLEETLQFAYKMFEGQRGSETAFEGGYIQATRLLNSPQSLSRPRIPIMIGGGGERKTLRLVAQYADACNVFGDPKTVAHKFAVLQQHCEAVERPFEEIERTTLIPVRLSSNGRGDLQTPDQVVELAAALAGAGVQHLILGVADARDPAILELLGDKIVPAIHELP
jgi:F420-dependent oxidoreductase-like protein